MPKLLSVNVGLPRDVAWNGRTVRTAVWKSPVTGRRMARKLDIDGDAQGDLSGHGGEHRAVFVYQMDSYRYWERFLGRSDFTFGQFGENFTLDGLPDDEVYIGDRYRIGAAVFEVTQPRVTCYRVGLRMNEPRMPALLVAHHRPGFYFRVLQEGEVGAGDDIEKVADGPERITVAEIDALLYLPGHSRDQLQRALRVPALSPGWRSSFEAILQQESGAATAAGNAGLAHEERAPAWPGFRPMRVTQIHKESDAVSSFLLAPVDAQPLPAFQPGQFVVLRLLVAAGQPPILRSYSLSDVSAASHFRASVKTESHGIGSAFLCNRTRAGDVMEVSAPRGSFTLRSGQGPVVLLSAGVGATPVMAMLHALAAESSPREVWWIYGARNREDHPFAEESRALLKLLSRAQEYIVYSRPAASDRLGVDFNAPGHIDAALLQKIGVARQSDFYLCGPTSFLQSMREGLRTWGVLAESVHSEIFGTLDAITPGVVPNAAQGSGQNVAQAVVRGVAQSEVQSEGHSEAQVPAPHQPPGPPGTGLPVSFARSGITAAWDPKFASLLELAEACDVPVRWSCRSGVCHTCITGLIGGSIVYNPDPLEAPASGNVLICCSQPSTSLTLDL